MFNLEVSADVSRQTPESHSGGRRFEPAERDQLHQVSESNAKVFIPFAPEFV